MHQTEQRSQILKVFFPCSYLRPSINRDVFTDLFKMNKEVF